MYSRISSKGASAAYRANCAVMNAVVAALKLAGVPSKDIQTTDLYLSPRYSQEEKTGRRNLDGYEVRQSVSVKVRDLSKVSAVLDAGVAAGANDVGRVFFTVEDPRKYTQDARVEALKTARTKAEKIAEAAGMKLGRPLSISDEGTSYSDRDYGRVTGLSDMVGLQAGVAGIEAGETKLTQTMSVTYEIE
jgi:hypothetical protein